MCINPSFVWVERGPKWEQQPVPCKNCWRCRNNRVNDYVGRSLCEAAYADHTLSLTLTYAPRDDLAERVITPSHFQDFVRSLRDTGHHVRYLVAGEYGDRKGRAHFHAILFFQGTPLPIPEQENHHIAQWPHGHVFGSYSADERALRYVCKYLLKDKDKRFNSWFSLSKKPPIGWAFFQDKAERLAELGVWPSSFTYLPPGGRKDREYLMTGKTRLHFMNYLMELRGCSPDPATVSEWVGKEVVKVERMRFLQDIEAVEDEIFMLQLKERIAEQQTKAEREWQRKELSRLEQKLVDTQAEYDRYLTSNV